jgi:hypothetical protein
MYGVWPGIFGFNPLIIILHAGVAVLYCIFRIVLFIEKRRRREPVRVDLP